MTAEIDAFREEARAWLAANFPAPLREHARPLALRDEGQGSDAALWKQRLADKGWGAPTWPVELGGGGLDARRASVLKSEMDAIGGRCQSDANCSPPGVALPEEAGFQAARICHSASAAERRVL